MRHAIAAGLVLLIATAAPRASAQSPEAAPTTIRVSSRALPHEPGDLFLLSCDLSAADGPLDLIVPWRCVRRMTGTLERVSADTVVFNRNGRAIHLAARDVRKLESLDGRSASRTIAWGMFGALAGVTGAAMIGIGGGYGTDAQFVATAATLGIGGAAIGAYRGGPRWSEWPRSFAAPATSSGR